MAAPNQQQNQANIQAALAAGHSQARIDQFLAGHQGDSGRLLSALAPELQNRSATPSTQGAMAGLMGAGPALPSTTGAVNQNIATPQPNLTMASGGGGGMADIPGAGALRAGLGRRILPDESGPLAGLKRAY